MKVGTKNRQFLSVARRSFFLLLALLVTVSEASAQERAPAPTTRPSGEELLAQGQALIQEERWAEAIEVFRTLTRQEPEQAQGWSLLGYSLHAAGDVDQALPYHLMAAEFPETAPAAMYNIACVYARRNKSDQAFEWLDRAWEKGFRNANAYRHDPDLNTLRDDPRFARFAAKGPPRAPRPRALIREPAPAAARQPQPRPEVTTIDLGVLPPERRFDFWLGEWNVSWDGGAGTNTITRILEDRVIHESFEGRMTDGSILQGISVSTYVPEDGRWHQTWVDSSGGYLDFVGGLSDDAMIFRRQTTREGKPIEQRMVFSSITREGFDWVWERSADGGLTWEVLWRIRYERKASMPEAAAP